MVLPALRLGEDRFFPWRFDKTIYSYIVTSLAVSPLQAFKAQFFRALAHPVRIKILEILVRGDRTVQQLQDALGLMQPVVSQQLAVLRNHGIVATEKHGVTVRYALRDPAVGELLDVARRIFSNHLIDTQGMLRELKREGRNG
jgi:DNA-binding transcriptional ArsR family regulator